MLRVSGLKILGRVGSHFLIIFNLKKNRILYILKGISPLKMHKIICLFVFVALRPMSTAMVIAGRSVHLTTLFPGQA